MKWASKASNKNISAAVGACPNETCLHCQYKCTSRKRLLVHASLHWTHNFCPCGYASRWCDTVRKHQAATGNGCHQTEVHEVDKASYQNWQRMLQITLGPYPTDIASQTATPATVPPTARGDTATTTTITTTTTTCASPPPLPPTAPLS